MPRVTDFPHPSRPGHFGVTFSKELTERVTLLATALIPGDDDYPSAEAAQVARFIEDRASEADRQMLLSLADGRHLDSLAGATEAIRVMEREDPAAFMWLREFVYHGYYASRRVLATMADRGYAYHGAPQPLGYNITEQMVLPSVARGRYIPTTEVSRASD